jgi:hypothetical protein
MKTTPGFYECPRCLKRDIYFAKRQVGQIGNLMDLPEGIANPAVSLGVEKDVALCRECGERANWTPEKVEYTDEEIIQNKAKNWKTQYKIASVLFFGSAIWIYIQVSSLSMSINDMNTARLFYISPIMVGLFCAYKGWKK